MNRPLPNGWRRVRLGEVLQQVNRFEPLRPEREYRMLGVKWYAQGMFERERKPGHAIAANALNRVVEGDFVYNRLFAWKGSFGLVTDALAGSYVSGEFPILRARDGEVLEEFLFHYFARPKIWEWIEHQSTGTTSVSRKRWKEEQFLELNVPLPPLADQRRIVDALRVMDEAIRANQEVLERTRAFKKALAHDLLTRGLPGKHTRFKDSRLGKIPADWEVKTIEEVCERIMVGIVVTPKKYYVERGVPALRSLNVRENRIEMTNCVHISSEANDLLAKSKLRAGDVVTVRSGEPGISAVVPPELEGANCVDLIICRPNSMITGTFLSRYLNSRDATNAIRIRQGGGAQQHLNVGAIRGIPITVPSAREQEQIANSLCTLDQYDGDQRSTLRILEDTKTMCRDALLAGTMGGS